MGVTGCDGCRSVGGGSGSGVAPRSVAGGGVGRFTVTKAWSILQEICGAVGVDGRDAEVIKIAANAVFRLPRAGMIVRISGSQAMAHRADKVVQVARWLARHDVPAVRLMPGMPAPLRVGNAVATLWIDVGSGSQAKTADWTLTDERPSPHPRTRGSTPSGVRPAASDLAIALKQLHTLPLPKDALPRWDPLDDVRRRLADAEELADADLALLRRMACRVEAALEDVRYALPPGIVHGDAHLGNLIRSRDGGVVLCDFDATCYGPTEWDLIPVAVGRLRFGYPPEQHAVLASSYGFDVTRWSGFEALRAVRELKLVTSVVPILASNPRVAAQFAVRLASLRYEDESVRWMPYS